MTTMDPGENDASEQPRDATRPGPPTSSKQPARLRERSALTSRAYFYLKAVWLLCVVSFAVAVFAALCSENGEPSGRTVNEPGASHSPGGSTDRTDGATGHWRGGGGSRNVVLDEIFKRFPKNRLPVYDGINDTFAINIAVAIDHGAILLSNNNGSWFAIGVNAYVKKFDARGKFAHRRVSRDEDISRLLCLLNETRLNKAFIFTWDGFTYEDGKPAGLFQCALVFVDSSTIYSIRAYTDFIVDLNNGQFSLYDYTRSKVYDGDLTSEGVRQTRIVNRLTDAPEGGRFPRVDVDASCDGPTPASTSNRASSGVVVDVIDAPRAS